MTNYEMAVYGNGTQALSKDLRTELNNVLKALKTIESGTWEYARALHKIESQKLYGDISLRKFCEDKEFLNPSTVIKCYKGVEVLDKYLVPNGYNMKDFTFNHCYLISGLGKENIQSFIDEIKANNGEPHIENMTVKQLTAYLEKWMKRHNNAVDVTPNGKAEAEAEAKAEAEATDDDYIKGLKKGVKIHFNGTDYFIKYEDLEQYKK